MPLTVSPCVVVEQAWAVAAVVCMVRERAKWAARDDPASGACVPAFRPVLSLAACGCSAPNRGAALPERAARGARFAGCVTRARSGRQRIVRPVCGGRWAAPPACCRCLVTVGVRSAAHASCGGRVDGARIRFYLSSPILSAPPSGAANRRVCGWLTLINACHYQSSGFVSICTVILRRLHWR